jgi:hypothetical protein
MANNKAFRFGPVAISNATGNLLNPPTASGGTNAGSSAQFILLRHIRITNKTASTATASLWIGATGASAAGTEFMGTTLSVAANSYVDWYAGSPGLRLDSADFLTGIASAATTLTIQGEGEIGVAG